MTKCYEWIFSLRKHADSVTLCQSATTLIMMQIWCRWMPSLWALYNRLSHMFQISMSFFTLYSVLMLAYVFLLIDRIKNVQNHLLGYWQWLYWKLWNILKNESYSPRSASSTVCAVGLSSFRLNSDWLVLDGQIPNHFSYACSISHVTRNTLSVDKQFIVGTYKIAWTFVVSHCIPILK